MGKEFDDLGDGSSQREWHRGWVNQAYRAIRPGGVIKAFCGTRTFHHLAAVIREVGFTDIRIEAWCYGSGFPKSMNISKVFLRMADADPTRAAELQEAAQTWDGWGTALKPAWEPVIVARKPLV
jgi:site-specific DNA-methyltransferase (adenine-specific)